MAALEQRDDDQDDTLHTVLGIVQTLQKDVAQLKADVAEIKTEIKGMRRDFMTEFRRINR